MEELHRLYAEEGYRFLLQDHSKYSRYVKSAFEIEEGYRPVMEIENTFCRFPPILLGEIAQRLGKIRDDFVFVSISNSIQYPFDKR